MIFKWLVKTALSGILWTFLLSIPYQGEPIFYLMRTHLLENSLVKGLDGRLAGLWDWVYKSGMSAFRTQPEEGAKL